MIFHRTPEVPLAGLIASILGLAYCIFISIGWGVDAVCLTSGCRLVSDFRLGWFSPWWIAAFIFACLLALSACRLRGLACVLATLFLLGDCLFLAAMLFISPCALCLVAALLIFATWLALRSKPALSIARQRLLNGSTGPLWLLLFLLSLVWLLLFLLNLGGLMGELPGSRPLITQSSFTQDAVADELAGSLPLTQDTVPDELTDSRPLIQNSQAGVTVYFSPSCPACRDAVRMFENSANFYPVAENGEDLAIIADLEARLAAGQSLAASLDAIQAQRENGTYIAPELALQQKLLLQFALLRNQARISRLGYDTLPVIMFQGLPKSWLPENTAVKPQPAFSFEPPFELPPDLRQGTAECGPAAQAAEGGAKDCE